MVDNNRQFITEGAFFHKATKLRWRRLPLLEEQNEGAHQVHLVQNLAHQI